MLLKLLNEFSKSNETRGLTSILSFFHNEFNKFNNIQAQTLDHTYNKAVRLLSTHIFTVKTSKHCLDVHTIAMDVII